MGCARCQTILSELEATESIPLQAAEKEGVLSARAAANVAGPALPKAAPMSFPEESRVTSIRHGVRWQWLAPAGALAAGLLLWVAWHKNRTLPVKPSAEVKMAKAEPPSTLASQATRQAPASLDQAPRASKDQLSIGGLASATKASPPEALKQFEKFDSPARTTPAKPLADKEARAREEARGDSTPAANRIQHQPARDAKAGVAGAVAETAEVQAQVTTAQVQNQQNQLNQANAQNVGVPVPPSQGQGAAKKAKSESHALAYGAAARSKPAPPQPPAPAPSAAFSDVSASARLIGGRSFSLIATPSKKILWRVGSAGRIEESNDGGTSWSPQSSNVFVDLTAGSAPSDKVCWIVGRAGTILLTTDAGLHWATIGSPIDEDLGGVRATDALRATIWNLGSTKVFETADSGLTWKPVQAQMK